MTIHVATLPFATDRGLGARARLGLVAAAHDAVIERDFHAIVGRLEGVDLYTARYAGGTVSAHAEARAALADLEPAVGLLLPDQRMDAVAVACGTTALTIGEDGIETMFRSSRPGLKIVTPIAAVRAALGVCGVRHVGVLTPYRGVFNAQIERALTRIGIEVGVFGSFEEEREAVIGSITEASIRQNVLMLAGSAPIDGFLIVGSQLRVMSIVKDLERELGLPVIGSGHALIWHTLRCAGIGDRISGQGLLFNLPI